MNLLQVKWLERVLFENNSASQLFYLLFLGTIWNFPQPVYEFPALCLSTGRKKDGGCGQEQGGASQCLPRGIAARIL